MEWKNTISKEDLEKIYNSTFIPWEKLQNSTIFITGATGLIGATLINALLYVNDKRHLNLSILALVRDKKRAVERFSGLEDYSEILRFKIGTVESLPEIDERIDYVIHGASQTASRMFIEQPVETIATAVDGTKNLLELARKKKVKGFVYLSSMEVYGYPERGHKVIEDEIGAVTPLDLRNSYPLSKQLCENMCCAYSGEYNVPARIIRLTQTFGPGVNYNDTRIFAEFGRCVIEKRDIVLRTTGETERSYLYTSDAVTAILTVLLKGKNAQAYNAADERTYCSIAEMAQKVAEMGGIQVKFDLVDENVMGYPKTLYMDLDTSLIRSLGWIPGGY